MTTTFKDYDGKIINLKEFMHIHSINDTVRDKVTAYADSNNDGFIHKEDVVKIDILLNKTNDIEEKMKNIVYIKQPIVTLEPGPDINNKIYNLCKDTPDCKIVFSNNAISSDMISNALLVSDVNSKAKAYIVKDKNIVYIHPEINNISIYANKNCSHMFANCEFITIDLSNFNTSKVTDMSYMFQNCYCTQSLDLSNFDTSQVENMEYIFGYDNVLSCIDLSNWNTSKVTNMCYMFMGCVELYTIKGLENIDTKNVINMSNMFNQCIALTSLDLSKWNTINAINMSGIFYGCSSLHEIKGIEIFNTSNVTDMNNMFNCCNNLTSLDLSNWDISKVTDIQYIFADCQKLVYLNISNWNTFNVTNMNYMFFNCNELASLELSNWNTSNLIYMSYIFSGCYRLIELNLTGWNTSKVTDINGAFNSCYNLYRIEGIENFDISNVVNLSNMFNSCNNLTSLNLSKWNTSNVTSTRSLFYNCMALVSLDLSNWNTSNLKYMQQMFESCNNLISITGLEKLDTCNIMNMQKTFYNCKKLSSKIIIKCKNITNYSNIFTECSILDNSKFIVDCTDGQNSLVENMIATKSSNSNVILGSIIVDLLPGEEFNNILSKFIKRNRTLEFTKTPIPVNLIPYATIVSNTNSFSKIYMYLDQDNIIVSPESENIIIHANADSHKLFYHSPYSVNNLYTPRINITPTINTDFLVRITLENFDTTGVVDMSFMFYNCDGVGSLDLSNFDTSKVTKMNDMFYHCTWASNIYLSNFDTSLVDDMSNMFSECKAVSAEITIRNSNISNYLDMFSYCCTKSSSKIVVNYINDATKVIAEKMVATKSSNSNVVLGTLVK